MTAAQTKDSVWQLVIECKSDCLGCVHNVEAAPNQVALVFRTLTQVSKENLIAWQLVWKACAISISDTQSGAF